MKKRLAADEKRVCNIERYKPLNIVVSEVGIDIFIKKVVLELFLFFRPGIMSTESFHMDDVVICNR